jgi:plastocyanin
VIQLLVYPVLLLIAVSHAVEASPASTAVTHTVEMRNFAFSPARLEVAVGDTVVWINRDAAPHTATDSLKRWDSGNLGPGERWTWVAGEPGHFSYLCTYHPSMTGRLTVIRSSEGRSTADRVLESL